MSDDLPFEEGDLLDFWGVPLVDYELRDSHARKAYAELLPPEASPTGTSVLLLYFVGGPDDDRNLVMIPWDRVDSVTLDISNLESMIQLRTSTTFPAEEIMALRGKD